MLSKEEKLEILYEMYDYLCSLSEDVKADALNSAIRAYATKLEVKNDFQLTWKMQDLTDKDMEAIKKCIDGKTITGQIKLPNSGKIGYWYKLGDDEECEGFCCSRCHKNIYKLDYFKTTEWKGFKYCPYCGSHNLFINKSTSDLWDYVTNQCTTCATCKYYNTEDKTSPFCDIPDGVSCTHHSKWEKINP